METRESGWDEVSVMHGRHTMFAGSSFLSPVLTTATGPDTGDLRRKIVYRKKSANRQYPIIRDKEGIWQLLEGCATIGGHCNETGFEILQRHTLHESYSRGRSVVDSCNGGGDGLQEERVVSIRSLPWVLLEWGARSVDCWVMMCMSLLLFFCAEKFPRF